MITDKFDYNIESLIESLTAHAAQVVHYSNEMHRMFWALSEAEQASLAERWGAEKLTNLMVKHGECGELINALSEKLGIADRCQMGKPPEPVKLAELEVMQEPQKLE